MIGGPFCADRSVRRTGGDRSAKPRIDSRDSESPLDQMCARRNMKYIQVSEKEYLKVAKELKAKAFRRLLTVSAVDWVEPGAYEVYFVVHSMEEGAYVKVATRIPRDDPKIATLSEIWTNAAMHEREAWELFGIDFIGNTILEPLFLEDWVGPPPFNKNCDWTGYVKENFDFS